MKLHQLINFFQNRRKGSIFDEALLLSAKGLLLLIIIAGVTVAVIPLLEKITSALQALSDKVPQ